MADYVTNIGTASGCTLDLNGFRITTSQVVIYENHVLTIIDSSEKKTGSMGALWVDGDHVTIRDGSYVAYDAADDLTKTVSVVPCDYEGWYSSAVCPYCAQPGAVRVPVTLDGTAQYALLSDAAECHRRSEPQRQQQESRHAAAEHLRQLRELIWAATASTAR